MFDRAKDIEEILCNYPQYKETLFSRGYLITNMQIEDTFEYPFYGNWYKYSFKAINFNSTINIYYNKLQNCNIYQEETFTIGIIGHAYNPFSMKYEEMEILKECLQAYKKGEKAFFDKISELTGIHLIFLSDNKKIIAVQDCAGMKSCYFGNVGDYFYITSHSQLVADICKLNIDPYVDKLVKLKCYNIGNRHLPGNITPYKELKRLGGNTFLEYENRRFIIKRFFPYEPHLEIKSENQYNDYIARCFDILNKNIKLTTLKWKKTAISLSGGMDSRTTLSCANGLYDKFSYFSFHCKSQEFKDALVARRLCEIIGVPHTIYAIPESNDEIKHFGVLKKVINHNLSYFQNFSDHEIRKMVYLYNNNGFEVELKSWVSEIARCSLERRYGIKMPKILTSRHFSIFQTRYFMAPFFIKEADKLNSLFAKETNLEKPLYNYEHADLYHWEVRLGAWGTAVVSAFDLCHNVTMPFNNRKLIEMLLAFPHEDRANGEVHKRIINFGNDKLGKLDITKNDNSKKYRLKAEQLYYYYRTLFCNH